MNPALHVAIIAARRRQEEEEQKMTQYNAEDLNGWEFKIVRSTFRRFRNAEVIRRLMEEEAQNGWEMVEKFDDYRIRFKRRTDKRALHSGGSVDPYRTNYGTSQIILRLVAVAVALALAIILFFAVN
jgi:transposase